MAERLKNPGPVVTREVMLDFVEVELRCWQPLRGGKLTPMRDVIPSEVHVVTSLYLYH